MLLVIPFYLVFPPVLALSSIKNNYLMISMVLICKNSGFLCWNYSRHNAALLAFFVNTEPANKTFQNSIGTDRYTLIEQSSDHSNHYFIQTSSGFEVQLLRKYM